ncbi:MAG: arsenical pump-driving ATPase [Gammaproteobacteria bacterium]|jgi:arsenite-transporting ATPase|nr:arsenical pump-driving ATPase [Gammaproteobacteria bacterium]MBT3723397.1 arsenical pump-driving ATPase [Gammaproteobacteria bacterium]MBT4077638.1 arsenical pump-driving ATPase [Gammaproteobacteria bacterium]MBT4196357.1 arsenical pump-driving ATPase [Gammaproteobacteria bacterium]MBT4452381.1 arsenical pump-driving ATPase [Gammaproteobacteria bacterium]
MNLLNNPTPFLFFTGKGGVGKTSVSCSLAVSLADSGKTVLLVSTDPASNLDQVLNTQIAGKPTPINDVNNLFAVNINPERAAEEYRQRIIGPYRDELPESMIKQMEEQLSGACTVEIAAFDEFTGFLVDQSIIDRFDHIVFDTAPTGHTLRLLNLPAAWSGFLDENLRGATCLGPASGLKQQHERYASSLSVLSDKKQTTLVLVSRADEIALNEAASSGKELREQGITNQHLVINGVFRAGKQDDPIALAFQQRNEQALANMADSLAELPQSKILLKGHNIVGINFLRKFLSTEEMGRDTSTSTKKIYLSEDLQHISELIDDLAQSEKGLIMVMGKGGVGKTTIAAAVARELALRGFPVHLSTTDPAAHIQQVIDSDVDGLEISRIDPKQEAEAYTQYVLKTKGKNLDADGLALLEEDLQSPCTEEVAVFRAFSRTVSKARSGFVVLDTAPTGHTLLLLDTAGAYHREVERGSSKSDASFVTPLMRLQNPDFTRILIATLAETTPVSEAEKLQQDLGRAGIKPYAWVVNQSLAMTGTEDPVLRQRCESEVELITRVKTSLTDKAVVIPWLSENPTGSKGLTAITQNNVTHNG